MKVAAVFCLLVLGVAVNSQLIEETQDLFGAYLLSRPFMGSRGIVPGMAGAMNPFMGASSMMYPMGTMGGMAPFGGFSPLATNPYMFGKRK